MTRAELETIWMEERLWQNSIAHATASRNEILKKRYSVKKGGLVAEAGNLVRELQDADGNFCGYTQMPIAVWARNLRAS